MDKKGRNHVLVGVPLGIVSQGETNGAFNLCRLPFQKPYTEKGRNQSLSAIRVNLL